MQSIEARGIWKEEYPPEACAADDEFLFQEDVGIHLRNLLRAQKRADVAALAIAERVWEVGPVSDAVIARSPP